jgi:hypothetical protein
MPIPSFTKLLSDSNLPNQKLEHRGCLSDTLIHLMTIFFVVSFVRAPFTGVAVCLLYISMLVKSKKDNETATVRAGVCDSSLVISWCFFFSFFLSEAHNFLRNRQGVML